MIMILLMADRSQTIVDDMTEECLLPTGPWLPIQILGKDAESEQY